MTYTAYGRMSLDSCSREGEWYCLKYRIPVDKIEGIVAHYKKTWRYVELREEKTS